jgi:hypothetical protein
MISVITDRPANGVHHTGIRLAARPKLASLEKLPRTADRMRMQNQIEEAIEAEADERIRTVPRFRIDMERSSLSLPDIQPSTEITRPELSKMNIHN